MKLRYTLLISLLLVGSALFSYSENGFFGGIGSVGYTGSDVKNLESFGIDYNNKMGAYFSFFHYSQPKQNFQIRTEFSLTGRGADFNWEIEDGYTLEGTDKLWYIGVPVTGIINFPSSTVRKFYLGGGLSMNAAISGKESASLDGESDSFDIYDDLNKLLVGYQFCAGVNMERSIIELRYDRHIGHLVEDSDASIYNDAIWLLVGVKFHK